MLLAVLEQTSQSLVQRKAESDRIVIGLQVIKQDTCTATKYLFPSCALFRGFHNFLISRFMLTLQYLPLTIGGLWLLATPTVAPPTASTTSTASSTPPPSSLCRLFRLFGTSDFRRSLTSIGEFDKSWVPSDALSHRGRRGSGWSYSLTLSFARPFLLPRTILIT